MNRKVPFNSGMVVNTEGKILRAWSWAGDHNATNPCELYQDDGECVEIKKSQCDLFAEKIHICRFDKKSGKVINKNNGELIFIVGNKAPAGAGAKIAK